MGNVDLPDERCIAGALCDTAKRYAANKCMRMIA